MGNFLTKLKNFIETAKAKKYIEIDDQTQTITFIKNFDDLFNEGFIRNFFNHHRSDSFLRSMHNYFFSKSINVNDQVVYTHTIDLQGKSLEQAIKDANLKSRRTEKRHRNVTELSRENKQQEKKLKSQQKELELLQKQLKSEQNEKDYWKSRCHELSANEHQQIQPSQGDPDQGVIKIPQPQRYATNQGIIKIPQPQRYPVQGLLQPQKNCTDQSSSQERKRRRVDDSSDPDKRPNTYSFSIDEFVANNSGLKLKKGFSRGVHNNATDNSSALFSTRRSTNREATDDSNHSHSNGGPPHPK